MNIKLINMKKKHLQKLFMKSARMAKPRQILHVGLRLTTLLPVNFI